MAQDLAFAPILSHSRTPMLGVLAGALLTALVPSSSITTGLCILLVQQEILPAAAAIRIVIGANLGTIATALLARVKMHQTAQRAAVANFSFNPFGVLLFLPLLGTFADWIVEFGARPRLAFAWAKWIFNAVLTAAIVVLLQLFEKQRARHDARAAG